MFKSFPLFVAFIMSFIYIGIGIFILAKNMFNLSEFQQYGVSIILISYGIFRLYRAFKREKEDEIEDEE